MSVRSSQISRKTNETDIQIELTLHTNSIDALNHDISTGIGFLDHVSLPITRFNNSLT
jgi:imidazoleglycerol phosphate dehydratase HisB